MNKIITATIASLLINSCYALTEQELQQARIEASINHLKENNLPVPDGGIKVVPANKLSHYNDIKNERRRQYQMIKDNGYINEPSSDAELLFNLKKRALKDYENDNVPFNASNLRHDISELKLAYTFLGVPPNDIQEQIGVAPYLTYLEHQGWIGAIQFFTNNDLGNCAFYENNVRLGHGSIVIAKEDRRNDVNNKDTLVYVQGTKSKGFVYTVEWFDLTFFRKLQCANHTYSQDIKTNLIELAKRIDNYNGPLKS